MFTGAGRGIGLTAAKSNIREDSSVAIDDVDTARTKIITAARGETATAVEINVTNQQSIDSVVTKQ